MKADEYRRDLKSLENWDDYLLQHSGLPGPRGNIELAQVVADEGSPALFERYLGYTADLAPVNSPYEFLAFCGAVGLGRLAAEGQRSVLATLRNCASDPRWRMREGVAMALQRLGDADMPALIAAMRAWADGNPYEQRAAAAALCEPRLLKTTEYARVTLEILETITAAIEQNHHRKSEDFITLKKGLAYCWSVAVAALPQEGKPYMERWLASADPDIRWIMKENLSKNRLERVDPQWVEHWRMK